MFSNLFRLLMLLVLFPASVFAQHEPVVRVQVQSCQQNRCFIGNGNAVVIGNNGQSLLVLTAAHNVRGAQSTAIMVQGRWVPSQVQRTNTDDDIATIIVPGSYPSVVPATVGNFSPTHQDTLEMRGYWPGGWKYQVRQARRTQSRWQRVFGITQVSVEGCSGSPVFCRGQVVGIVVQTTNQESLVVPGELIHRQLILWGYAPESAGNIANSRPAIREPRPEPPVSQVPVVPDTLTRCDCNDHLSRQAAAIKQLSLQLQTLRQELQAHISGFNQDNTDSASEIADLQKQIMILHHRLATLEPLKERRLILMSDGQVTSQRVLSPSDPIVLGSEIVVRKPHAGN